MESLKKLLSDSKVKLGKVRPIGDSVTLREMELGKEPNTKTSFRRVMAIMNPVKLKKIKI